MFANLQFRLLLAGTLLGYLPAAAQNGPQPPCGKDSLPAWPGLDDAPIVKLWSRADFGRDWKPPECTAWAATGFTTLVNIAARFRSPGDADRLLHRVGAISELTGMQYWSTTHSQWRVLIPAAYAVTGPRTGQPRGDFTPDELRSGRALYFQQEDNLSGKGTYQLRVMEASQDRIVYSVENVQPIRFHLIPVFDPAEMQSIYFLDRESQGVWRYYSIMRMGKGANPMITRNESSAINRAVAFFRWVVGIPGAQEPPAAR